MHDYAPYDLNILYRSTHSVVWELAEKSGMLRQLRLSLKSLEPADNPREAEDALFRGDIDFVSGNHVTPYRWIAQGKPIVCIASPNNGIRDRVATREPVTSLADFAGKSLRVADTDLYGADDGAISHTRGNHILEIAQAGFPAESTEWLQMGESHDAGFQAGMIDAVKSGRADIAFVPRNPDELIAAGLHILDLPAMPMVTGTTITTSYEALHKKEGLGERLVQALILTIHYARMHPEEAQKLMDTKLDVSYRQPGGRAKAVSRFVMKAYPTPEAVANAFELCSMQFEETRSINPLALWDTRFLKDLDVSGFIDELIQEEPAGTNRADDGVRLTGE
jgi:hypothetical protein